MRILVPFSGGLDSTVTAILLKANLHEIHASHLVWDNRRGIGGPQAKAAEKVANILGLPFAVIGRFEISTTILWSPVFISVFMDAARRGKYDAIAFGFVGGQSRHDWFTLCADMARAIGYTGHILFPVRGMDRRSEWNFIPKTLKNQLYTCHSRRGSTPCGRCIKCATDLKVIAQND